MGARMGPSCANLFMGKFDQKDIDNSLLKPFIWWRFMIWTHGEKHLETSIDYLNSIHPSIKFTQEYSNSLHQTLPFLDIQVHLINNHIQTDVHTKTTERHQYLLRTSCHPNHTKNDPIQPLPPNHPHIPPTLSLTNEAENSSSTWPNVAIATTHYKEIYANRVHSIPRYGTLRPREQKSAKTNRTPFVISFNPAPPKISSVVNKYTTLFQSTANWKKAFPN